MFDMAMNNDVKSFKFAGYTHVNVHTDSEFVQKGATQWMPNWKQNGWQTSSGRPVANRGDWERLDRASSGMNVTYVSFPEDP